MSAYISLDTLAEWREDAEKRAARADSHLVFAARIVRLIDALKAPCGSCHPCNNWANQTWVNAGERLPHVHEWQEVKERAEKAEAALAEAEQKGAREALLAAADALDAKFSDKSGPALSGSGWLRDRAAQFGSEMACDCGAPVAEHGGETDDCPVGGDS